MTTRTGPWSAVAVFCAVIVTPLFVAMAGVMTVAVSILAGVLLIGYALRRVARGTVQRLRSPLS